MRIDDNSGFSNSDSTAEINPYASPAEAGGYDDRQPFGVGVWRDGALLVMHQKAELPRFCIHTGEPAVGGREYVLVWKPPGAIFTTSKAVLIPLCRACVRQFLRLRIQIFGSLALGMLGCCLVLSSLYLMSRILGLSGLGLVIFAILYGLYALGVNSRELTVAHSQGDYLWLRGVHSGLLQRLPAWPPSGGG